MSYDIALYPRQPGQDWDAVIEADQQDGPAMDQAQLDAGVATFRRIEARLREQLTEPVEVWVAEETDGDVVGELDATESGLQVELYDRSASVSFPYWERDNLPAFHDLVRRAVAIVADETGYQAYDPQTGSAFDGTFSDESGLAATRSLAAGEDPGATAGAVGADASGAAGAAVGSGGIGDRMDPRRSPQALRRRAWLYVVIGVILTFFGAQRWMAGDTGLLTWFILGIGAFDLIGGWLMFTTSRRLAEHEAAGTTGASGTPTDDDGTPGITRL